MSSRLGKNALQESEGEGLMTEKSALQDVEDDLRDVEGEGLMMFLWGVERQRRSSRKGG